LRRVLSSCSEMKILLLIALCAMCHGQSLVLDSQAEGDPAGTTDYFKIPREDEIETPEEDVHHIDDSNMDDSIEKRGAPVCHWRLGQATSSDGKFKELGKFHGQHPMKGCAAACAKEGGQGAQMDIRTGRNCICVHKMSGFDFKLDKVVTGESDNPPRYVSCKFGASAKPIHNCKWEQGKGHSKEVFGIFGNTELRLHLGSVASRDICAQMCVERKKHWVKIDAVTVKPSKGQCWCEIGMKKKAATPSSEHQFCKL